MERSDLPYNDNLTFIDLYTIYVDICIQNSPALSGRPHISAAEQHSVVEHNTAATGRKEEQQQTPSSREEIEIT